MALKLITQIYTIAKIIFEPANDMFVFVVAHGMRYYPPASDKINVQKIIDTSPKPAPKNDYNVWCIILWLILTSVLYLIIARQSDILYIEC